MRNLDDVRKEITENDKQIVRLFEKRMNLSKEVAQYKKANNMNVFDSSREAKVIDNFASALENSEYTKWAVRLICELMNSSKELQHTLTDTKQSTTLNESKVVACQGVVGAYGEEAASSYFGDKADIKCLPSFEDVFCSVSDGRADLGILPIENSSTGAIGDVYDLFSQYNCHIAGEYILRINHCLMAPDGASTETIKEVYSHTQGFEQSSTYLSKYPHLNLIPYHNTAVSAKYVSDSGDITKSAVASARAAKIYNLKILAENINNNYNNYTRFIVIAKNDEIKSGADKVSVMLRLAHQKGTLYTLMKNFEDYGVNLLKIESRPIPNKSWEYNFFIDFSGDLNDYDMQELIKKLSDSSISFRLLGNYKAAH